MEKKYKRRILPKKAIANTFEYLRPPKGNIKESHVIKVCEKTLVNLSQYNKLLKNAQLFAINIIIKFKIWKR